MGNNLFGIGIGELIFLAALALIVFGPKRLPEVARTVGRMMQQFRQVVDEAQEEARWLMGEVPLQAGPPPSAWPGSPAAALNSPGSLLPGQLDGAPSPPAERPPEQGAGRRPLPLEHAAPSPEQAAEEEPVPPFSPLAG